MQPPVGSVGIDVGAVGGAGRTDEIAASGGIRMRCRPGVHACGLVIIIEAVNFQQDFTGVGWFVENLYPAGYLVLVVDRMPDGVRDVALVIRAGEGGAHGELIVHRRVDRAFGLDQPVVAESRGHIAVVVEIRLLADVVDQAAGRVAAEQRALRAAQHFDALYVEQRAGEGAHGGDVGVIGVHRDRRFLVIAEIVLRNAAQVVNGDGGAVLVELHAGSLVCNRSDVGDSELLQRGAVKCGDGSAHGLQVLLALLGGHRDFIQRIRVGRCRISSVAATRSARDQG